MIRRLLDQDPRREQRRQSLLLDRISDQFEDKLAEEIADAMRESLRTWEITREVFLPRDFRQRLEATYSQMITASITTFGSRVFEQGKAAGVVLERKEDFATFMLNAALRYISDETIRQRISSVESTTRFSLVRLLARAFVDGLTQTETVKSILEVIGSISKMRARTIARTETHGAANYGANVAAKRSDLPMSREWLSAQDKRTRTTEEGDLFDHVGANGQVVGRDEPFQIARLDGGTEALMFPGDPNGSAGNVINCRCSLGFIVDTQAIIAQTIAAARGQQSAAPVAPIVLKPVTVPAKPAFVAPVIPNKIPELEKFIIANGIAIEPKLTGLKADGIAQLTKAALEVTQRFGLDPLRGVGPSSRFGLGKTQNANAAIFRFKDKVTGKMNGVFHTPTVFGSLTEYTKQHASNVKNASSYYSTALKKINNTTDQYVKDNIGRVDGVYSWTYSGMKPPEQKVTFTTFHEYGHVLHLVNEEVGKEINQFLSTYRPIQTGWSNLISEYAGTKDVEYVAEAFSIYMDPDRSQRFRVHPELIKVFAKWDNKP